MPDTIPCVRCGTTSDNWALVWRCPKCASVYNSGSLEEEISELNAELERLGAEYAELERLGAEYTAMRNRASKLIISELKRVKDERSMEDKDWFAHGAIYAARKILHVKSKPKKKRGK